MPIILPETPADRVKIDDIRRAMKALIEAATDNKARVHATWKLRADMAKGISLFQRDEDQKIHGWMIGPGSILTQTNATGGREFIGGRKSNRVVRVIIWGLYDYTLFDSENERTSLTFCETEAEYIADVFEANGVKLGLDTPPKGIAEVRPFQIENLDVHSFSEGFDAHLAQCYVDVVLTRGI